MPVAVLDYHWERVLTRNCSEAEDWWNGLQLSSGATFWHSLFVLHSHFRVHVITVCLSGHRVCTDVSKCINILLNSSVRLLPFMIFTASSNKHGAHRYDWSVARGVISQRGTVILRQRMHYFCALRTLRGTTKDKPRVCVSFGCAGVVQWLESGCKMCRAVAMAGGRTAVCRHSFFWHSLGSSCSSRRRSVGGSRRHTGRPGSLLLW